MKLTVQYRPLRETEVNNSSLSVVLAMMHYAFTKSRVQLTDSSLFANITRKNIWHSHTRKCRQNVLSALFHFVCNRHDHYFMT